MEWKGRRLYVGRAQKKREREVELKRWFEQMEQERFIRYQVPVTSAHSVLLYLL